MIQKLIPRCIKGNLATNVCISKACYELNPFVCVYCNNQSCKKIHSKCQIIKWGDLKKKMEQQIKVRGLKLLNFIDRVENVFKTLKDLYESEYNSYRQWIQQLSLSQQKKQCYQKISVKRWNDITGSMLAEFYDNDDKEYQYVKSVNEKYFEQRRVELLNKLEHIRVEIPNMYKEAIIEQKKVKKKKKVQSFIQKLRMTAKVFPNQNIITNIKEEPVILELLSNIIFRQNQQLRVLIEELKKNPLKPNQLIIKAFKIYEKNQIGKLDDTPRSWTPKMVESAIYNEFAQIITEEKYSNLELVAFYWGWQIEEIAGLKDLNASLAKLKKLQHVYIFSPYDCNLKRCFEILMCINKITLIKQNWIEELIMIE